MGTIDVVFAGTPGFTASYEPAKVLDLPFSSAMPSRSAIS